MDDEKNSRDPIWSIYSKWRGCFCAVLVILGICVCVDVLHDKGNWIQIWNEARNILKAETLNEVGESLISSVVFIWFLFQTAEVFMGAYQWYLDRRQSRDQKIREEVMEKTRKEERERTLKIIENAKKEVGTKASASKAFQAMESACSYSRDNK